MITVNILNKKELEQASIEIFDMAGNLLQQINSVDSLNNIDVSNYAKGTFIISLKTKKGPAKNKLFVVQ